MKCAIIFAFLVSKIKFVYTYVSVPENVCPSNLAMCEIGDHQVISCYLSVEKVRVRVLISLVQQLIVDLF